MGSLYDPVILREEISPTLLRDTIGVIRRVIAPDRLEVEFYDDYFKTIATVTLSLAQVSVLRYETTLDIAQFWGLIDDARAASGGDMARESAALVDALAQRPIADIVEFGEMFDHFIYFAYRRELWAAAYVIRSGCSDDGFMDFRTWLVGQGKQIYYDALDDPETLVDLIALTTDTYGTYQDTYGDFELGGIYSVSQNAYERRVGRPWNPFRRSVYRVELTGRRWTPEAACAMYPKLTAKFNPRYPAK